MVDTIKVPSYAEGPFLPGVLSVRRRLLELFICLTTSLSLLAISPEDRVGSLSVSHWGAQNGIPEETFSALIAPGDGYVWLASNDGVVRFDGQRAQVLRLGDRFRPMGTGSCSGSTLSSLLLGPDKNVWVGASSGCIFHVKRDRFGGFANFQLSAMEAPNAGREVNAVLAMRISPDQRRVEISRRAAISTVETATFLAAQPGGLQKSSPEVVTHPAPSGRRLTYTARGDDGKLWALMSDGKLYEGQSPGPGWTPVAGWSQGAGVTAQRLLAGRNGAVWIATTRGVVELKDGTIREWGVKDGLPAANVLSLHEDRAGCLWMGLQQFVSRLCRGKIESISVGAEQEEMLSAITEDPQGNLWMGGRWGNLFRLSPANFLSFTRREGLPESHLTGVTVDREGAVWGSLKDTGLVRIVDGRITDNPRGTGFNQTQALVAYPAGGVLAASSTGLYRVDRNGHSPVRVNGPVQFEGLTALDWETSGNLLLSTGAGQYRLRPSPTGEPFTAEVLTGPARIRQWTKDPAGRVWALAQFAGLHYLDQGEYRPAVNAERGRARAWYSIRSDAEGLLWIGTTDGLEIYSTREKRFLTQRPILFGDQVFHTSEDRFGKVWCATRQGLVRFARSRALELASGVGDESLRQTFYERYGEAQALPTTNFGLVTSSTGATAPDGRIWIPGLLGLVSVQPADFERTPRPPAAVLLKLSSDGKAQDINQPLRIEPGHKTLEILFQTLRLDPLGGVYCRVRMEGFDANWGACNEQRTAQYTTLPPRDYAFVLQTSSQPGVWNGPELRVPVTIEPALHQRLGVQLGATVLFLAGFGFALWRRQKQLLERTRWLEEKVDERTATLENAKHAAEAANRAKSEFLATMSHEIRTPMNGVLGAVQILDDSPLNRDQKKLVSVIRQSGEDLVGIVDDILSLAKVEAGKLSLERAPVHIPSLADSLTALFRPKAEAKGVAICCEIEDGTPEWILSDPQRLRQILLNLLGNAVKFTGDGEVALRISSPEPHAVIVFSVVDTGLGIAPEKIPTLFEPFVQADSSTTRRFGGSGLGLSIVSRFVDAMGGTIDVQSTPEKGSVFLITLPCEVTNAPAPEPAAALPETEPISAANGRRGLTVLLAEDNNVNQMIFQKMLIRLGCEVILAKHGREALEALRKADVDLVLMDCQMPELDGYQTTRELRAWGGSFASLPVIALTASAMAEDRQNCIDAGMNDFLSKPLMLSTLEATLTQWSRRVKAPTESQP